jgi:16S rRNA (cytosine967-C5)-methyltransferase
VARRHPDIKWLRREPTFEGFARQQSRLLDALWGCLAHGGVFCTRHVRFSSGERGADRAFLARHADAFARNPHLPPESARRGAQLLPSLPGASHNQDGYFYALLRKP